MAELKEVFIILFFQTVNKLKKTIHKYMKAKKMKIYQYSDIPDDLNQRELAIVIDMIDNPEKFSGEDCLNHSAHIVGQFTEVRQVANAHFFEKICSKFFFCRN
jgi:hypothetical protein